MERENFRSCCAKQSCRTKTELEKFGVLWLATGSMAFVRSTKLSSAVYEWNADVLVELPTNKTVKALRAVKIKGKIGKIFPQLIERMSVSFTRTHAENVSMETGHMRTARRQTFSRKSWKFSFIDSKTLIFLLLREVKKSLGSPPRRVPHQIRPVEEKSMRHQLYVFIAELKSFD